MTRKSSDTDLTEHEKDVLTRLEATGWFVNKVAADKIGPGFAYSFGLYDSFNHPEIILFGLPPETMHQLINDIGKQLQNGIRYADGDQTHDLLEGYVCQFGLVDRHWYKTTLTWAGWFYKSVDFPALQLFWPDKAGLFPWNPGCNERVQTAQPDLRKPPTQR
jgi:hypothetical protein